MCDFSASDVSRSGPAVRRQTGLWLVHIPGLPTGGALREPGGRTEPSRPEPAGGEASQTARGASQISRDVECLLERLGVKVDPQGTW